MTNIMIGVFFYYFYLLLGKIRREKDQMRSQMENQMERELREAIGAGERALFSLRAAQEQLCSAGNWGLLDLFGGGFITDMVKHSKIEKAVSSMESAKRCLEIFKRELRDVSVRIDLNMDIGGFLTFADFFFDGLVADYLVRSKISEAREQVEDAISQVSQVMEGLQRRIGAQVRGSGTDEM